MLTRLVDAAQGRPSACESLRHILYGGGPIDVEDVKRALRRFGPTLSQVYGRMEGGWPIAVLGTEEHRSILAGNHRMAESCGRPIDSVSVRLRPVSSGDGDEGELCVSSDMNVAEYMGADGYCSLGDIMQHDENGYLYFRGRLDRMINTGYHIYPAEIEDVISGVPGVLEVLVAGEPSREWGETVVAYVVCSDKHASERLIASIKREISNELARYKMPRKFCVVDELPT
jgi:acyl-CoA synthetase (AMP-forming)/AMP-acid ligase II